MDLILNKYSNYVNENNVPLLHLNKLYTESHRFYHNWKHIENMLIDADNKGILDNELFLAILYHDAIYNPKSDDNELLSAKLFESFHGENQLVFNAILDTKTHMASSHLSTKLCELDLSILNSNLDKFIEFEKGIFKEYQFVDYSIYKTKRIEILEKLGTSNNNINYVKYFMPKIAIYAGSFNPFHKGHYNILEKAERIFDKVIIARGVNPQKNNIPKTDSLPDLISNRQIIEYSGLTTELLNSFSYEVTLIRGLRNTTDLQNEITQYKYMRDLKPNINVVSIFCDSEYEHISSSAIRSLTNYDKELFNKYAI